MTQQTSQSIEGAQAAKEKEVPELTTAQQWKLIIRRDTSPKRLAELLLSLSEEQQNARILHMSAYSKTIRIELEDRSSPPEEDEDDGLLEG